MKLALKVDVDTYRGTRDAVPHLIKMLARHRAQATFLFSLGPDHTGRAIRRAFRPGFLRKVSRTSVLSHYGVTTLLYGTLLPGPDIGRHCADEMRKAREEGFEIGIHSYDHVKWQDNAGSAGWVWTEREMRRACDRYQEIFGEPARVHGAAGWQMNIHAYRLAQQLGFRYCSDTRGTRPFIPLCDAEIIACPQLPTTLPTLDELIGRGGLTVDNVSRHLLGLTEKCPPTGHVYTLHAELEGNRLSGVFEQLLEGWKVQGYSLVSLGEYAGDLDVARLPRCAVSSGTLPGRSGTLSLQGRELAA